MLSAGEEPRFPGFHRAGQQLSEQVTPQPHIGPQKLQGGQTATPSGWSLEPERRPSSVHWQGLWMTGYKLSGLQDAVGKNQQKKKKNVLIDLTIKWYNNLKKCCFIGAIAKK